MIYVIAALLSFSILLVCQLLLWYASEAEFWRLRYFEARKENRS